LFKELKLSIDRPRPVSLWEPPGADPHARWCGGRGRKTPGYPIARHTALVKLRDYSAELQHTAQCIIPHTEKQNFTTTNNNWYKF
ncbi:hypothetical protein JWJ90_12410, partial [Desulfobulbus rhabdoformis]|uniref:hypothetical protein n=1 Tax=Desulfobulbus rhabdoformis TaxID=34032 RepID=UPI001966BEB7